MHQLVTVNGSQAAPIFHYLTQEAPGTLGKSIKWNFTKFLIDQNGQVIARYAPKTTPEKMIPAIEELLK
jgi:glutathione peroxidase